MINHYPVICGMDEQADILGYSLLKNGEEIGYYYDRQMAIHVALRLQEREA